MDSLVKQRLVGALILVALAVLFWPIVFVPGDGSDAELRIEVPAAPPVDLTPLPEPDNAGLRRGDLAAAQREEAARPVVETDFGDPNAPEPAAALPPREEVLPVASLDEAKDRLQAPELDDDGLPIAFSLQVATIGDRERAEALRDDLVKAGYKGYLQRLRRDDRTLYRVLVGPRYRREDLLPVKATIDRSWKVESMIIRYLP